MNNVSPIETLTGEDLEAHINYEIAMGRKARSAYDDFIERFIKDQKDSDIWEDIEQHSQIRVLQKRREKIRFNFEADDA